MSEIFLFCHQIRGIKSWRLGFLLFFSVHLSQLSARRWTVKQICQASLFIFCNGWTAAFRVRGHLFTDCLTASLSLQIAKIWPIKQVQITLHWTCASHVYNSRASRRGLLWKEWILPFVVFQEQRGGGVGWDKKGRQKERQKEKRAEWAARAEILRLLASRAKRLVLLALLWLADLGRSASSAWRNFYPGHLYRLISHLSCWQINRASGAPSNRLISVLMWY